MTSNNTLVKRLYGLTALSAFLGFGMSLVIEIFELVVPSKAPAPTQFGGHASGLAGALPRVIDLLSYFTIWSQIVVGVVMYQLWRKPNRDSPWFRVFLVDAVLMITVTGIVYHLLVAPTSPPESFNIVSSFLEHTLTPIMTILVWVVAGPRGWFSWNTVVRALVFPISFIGYTLVRGAVIGQYPYDFFDVAAYGLASVMQTVVGILLASLIFLVIYLFIDKALTKRKTT